jgi:hypothetical protein
MAQPPKRRKPRAHLPALSQARLNFFVEQMRTLPIPRAAQDAVIVSLSAARNPSAESPSVVIDSLLQEERDLIVPFEASYNTIFGGVGARGRAKLLSDFGLDELIEQEANDNP